MRMIISGRHLDITEAIRDYSEKKVGRLKKYFDNIMEIDVTLSVEHLKEGPEHIADVLIFANGTKIKAVSRDKNLYAAIDEVVDVLENQVTKYKEKLRDNRHKHNKAFVIKNSKDLKSDHDKDIRKVISTKLTSTKPMDVEEAILQMEALEAEFYPFMNHETEQMNLVYKRKDGDYGHVEPDWTK